MISAELPTGVIQAKPVGLEEVCVSDDACPGVEEKIVSIITRRKVLTTAAVAAVLGGGYAYRERLTAPFTEGGRHAIRVARARTVVQELTDRLTPSHTAGSASTVRSINPPAGTGEATA